MPTKKKRVGFIPREDVMRIIDELSIENNLSNSKIISILVEEALSIRGIFNKSNVVGSHSYQSIKDYSVNFSKNADELKDNANPIIGPKSDNHYKPTKSIHLNETNHCPLDLQTYKKFISFLKFQEMMEKYNT